jgi:hypothetical protein
VAHAVAYGLLFQSLALALVKTLSSQGKLDPRLALRTFEEKLGEDLAARAKHLAVVALKEQRKIRDEIDGEDRERLAHEVAARSDLVLCVVDGDITQTERSALHILAVENRPLILVLNKVDRYTQSDRDLLLDHLTEEVQR